MATPLHIIKIGGKLINDPDSLAEALAAFESIEGAKILIHGGGRKATQVSEELGIPVQMIEGRRITSAETLEVAIMVYAGLINKNIVAQLQSLDVNAIGLTGADANAITSVKRPVKDIDYGYVGDVQQVAEENIDKLLHAGLIPVFCALTHDGHGQLLNTNADTIAAQVAIAMTDKYDVTLSYCFEYKGVLLDINEPDISIGSLSHEAFEGMKTQGTINAGMIPKLSNGYDALAGGVKTVAICGVISRPTGFTITSTHSIIIIIQRYQQLSSTLIMTPSKSEKDGNKIHWVRRL